MKNFFAFLFAIASATNHAQQNLVPNFSFEDTIHCPKNGRMSNCAYWINCRATPDYLHTCSSGFGVPINSTGYQFAATGDAYAGINTYTRNSPYREFIGVSLLEPMIRDSAYQVSFKCSPGDPGFGYCLQANKLGIRFSTIPYDSLNPVPIDNFAHIWTDNIITDTSGWTTINGEFVADSSYTFLVIGNCFENIHTDTLIPGFQCAAFAYYYIDDVEVYQKKDVGIGNARTQPIVIQYNPQTQEIILVTNHEVMFQIKVFDMLGRKVEFESFEFTKEAKLSTADLSSGAYIATIETEKQRTSIKFFIHK